MFKFFNKCSLVLLSLFASTTLQASGAPKRLVLEGQDDELFGGLITFFQKLMDNMTGGLAMFICAGGMFIAYLGWTFDPKSEGVKIGVRAITGFILILSLFNIITYLVKSV